MAENQKTDRRARCYLWRITGPEAYQEGPMDELMSELCGVFLRHDYNLRVRLGARASALAAPGELFEELVRIEKDQGVEALVKLFMDGLVLEASRAGITAFRLEATLDLPASAAEQEQFRDMVCEWVGSNGLSYLERFYRRPTLAQDPADHYLDNSLESCLQRVFGFALQYRVGVGCLAPFVGFEEGIKEELAQALAKHAA